MELYNYRALVINVVDGDTVDVLVDLGFYLQYTMRVRLYGINTPEMKGDSRVAGLAAKVALSNLVLGQSLLIRTHKDRQDKYGRFLAELYLNELNVNKWLVENGHAVPFMV